MTHDHDRPAPDHGDSGAPDREALNRWLNARADGDPLNTDLDPDLRRTAERLSALSDATIDAHLDPARRASSWQALVRPAATPDRSPVSPATPIPVVHRRSPRRRIMQRSPTGPQPTVLTNSRPAPLARIDAPQSPRRASGWRLVGSRTMGVAATLLLVAMLALSGVAVYLTAPRHSADGPTSIPAIAAGSATPDTPSAATVPADVRDVIAQTCTAQPVNFNQLMTELAPLPSQAATFGQLPPDQGGLWFFTVGGPSVPTPPVLASRHLFHPRGTPVGAPPGYTIPHIVFTDYILPEGAPPTPAVVDAALTTFGQWINCSPLRAASLSTDALYQRNAYVYGGGGGALVALWQDSQRTTPSPDPFATGATTGWQLFDWTMLDPAHVAAFISSRPLDSGNRAPSSRIYSPSAYVVFAMQPDGRWLVDDYRDQLNGTCGQAFADDWCNP